MAKQISHVQLTSTLGLTEMTDGFWLYDKTRGFNLAMRAKTATQAFVNALSYYQERLTSVEHDHKILKEQVENFVSHFTEEE